ncbi:hypothetical protein BDP27DRAFT_1333354 [Rhodocollybia butyracea]|uniref:Uncharacterized protein n=1 Tax=Rhodocollybia butyracea TaxID=206335 RepID=A0A9P5PMH0_9AGAR|nr:hypothetical protein BDP27DRAFT_1333354 [Rhodocollybia butyracea]
MASNKSQRVPIPLLHPGAIKDNTSGSATTQKNQPGYIFHSPSSRAQNPLYASPNPEAVQFLLNHVGTYPSGQGIWYPPHPLQHNPQPNNSSPQMSNVYAPLPSSFPAFPASISKPQQQTSGSDRAIISAIPSPTTPFTPSPSAPSPSSPFLTPVSSPLQAATSSSHNARPRKKLRSVASLLSSSRRTSSSPALSQVSSTHRSRGSSSPLSLSSHINSTTPSPTHTNSTMTRSISTRSYSSSPLASTPSSTPAGRSPSGSSSMRDSTSPIQIYSGGSASSPAFPTSSPTPNPTAPPLPPLDTPHSNSSLPKRKRKKEAEEKTFKRSSTFPFSAPACEDGSCTSPIVIRSRSNSPVSHTHAAPIPATHSRPTSTPPYPYPTYPPYPPTHPPTPLELSAILKSQCLSPSLLHLPLPLPQYPIPTPDPPPTVASLIHIANTRHAQQTLAAQRLRNERRTREALEARERAREVVCKMGFEYKGLVSEDLERFINPNEGRYLSEELGFVPIGVTMPLVTRKETLKEFRPGAA